MFASILIRDRVPADLRDRGDRDGIRIFYQTLLDDMNRMSREIGWEGCAVIDHRYTAATGKVVIKAIAGPTPATLQQVKATSKGGGR